MDNAKDEHEPPQRVEERPVGDPHLEEIRGQIDQLRADLIVQDHRFFGVIGTWIESRRKWPQGDKKRTAAMKALAFRFLLPSAAVTGIGAGVLLSWLNYLEFRKQNESIVLQTTQMVEQNKSIAMQSEAIAAQIDLQQAALGMSCRAHPSCEKFGLCNYSGGLCIATDQSCQQSEQCAVGRCVADADGKGCMETDKYCSSSRLCRDLGFCRAAPGQGCVLTADGCLRSRACLNLGQCDFIADGSKEGGACLLPEPPYPKCRDIPNCNFLKRHMLGGCHSLDRDALDRSSTEFLECDNIYGDDAEGGHCEICVHSAIENRRDLIPVPGMHVPELPHRTQYYWSRISYDDSLRERYGRLGFDAVVERVFVHYSGPPPISVPPV